MKDKGEDPVEDGVRDLPDPDRNRDRPVRCPQNDFERTSGFECSEPRRDPRADAGADPWNERDDPLRHAQIFIHHLLESFEIASLKIAHHLVELLKRRDRVHEAAEARDMPQELDRQVERPRDEARAADQRICDGPRRVHAGLHGVHDVPNELLGGHVTEPGPRHDARARFDAPSRGLGKERRRRCNEMRTGRRGMLRHIKHGTRDRRCHLRYRVERALGRVTERITDVAKNRPDRVLVTLKDVRSVAVERVPMPKASVDLQHQVQRAEHRVRRVHHREDAILVRHHDAKCSFGEHRVMLTQRHEILLGSAKMGVVSPSKTQGAAIFRRVASSRNCRRSLVFLPGSQR